MNIGIIGVGLMGGSIGKTAKKRNLATVFGMDCEDVLQKAYLTNAIDYTLDNNNVKNLDILFICAYPRAIPEIIEEYSPRLKEGAIICDIGGNKRAIVDCMNEISIKYPNLNFLACHPMAGREFTGISHSVTTLYDKCSFIIIPVKSSLDATSILSDFVKELGATNIIYTNAEHHDEMISYTSQLCHVVSSAFIKNPKAKQHFGYSAGSFKDLTRVAKLNPVMWSENMIDNRDYLINDIDNIILELQKYKSALENNDEKALSQLLQEGATIKENLKDKK